MKTYTVNVDEFGTKRWYFNDKDYTEAEWRKQLNKASCVGKVVEVDGVKYKLVKI